jgi:hypothetical protein
MAHDLSGVWSLIPRPRAPGATGPAPDSVAPYTPAGQAQFDFNTQELKKGGTITIDPVYKCHPPGLPHIYTSGAYAFEILETPQRIFIFYENSHLWREIWMDGREMPKDSDPLWMGYSIGHWDGEDLVVDTASFNDKTWLDDRGHPHSDAFKLTERYHRPDHDHLEISFTIDDPKFYKATWMQARNYALKPKWEIGEAFCIPEDQMKFFETNFSETGGKPAPSN